MCGNGSFVAYRSAVDADEAADELYALPPGKFTAARNVLAKAANASGDKETATQIAALRKPSTVAWLVNLLVRELPDEIGGFLDLGEALREATETLSGPELRQLGGQRHRLVQALVRQARELAHNAGYRATEDVSRGLEETLAAALTDAAVAEQLRAGRLTSGMTAIGFAAPSLSPVPVPAPPSPAPSRTIRSPTKTATDTPPPEPSAAQRRRQQAMIRLQRDLSDAENRATQASQAREVTAEAFEESQRALAETEMGVADLRAELERAERTRDQVKRDSERAQAADAQAASEEMDAGRRVADLLARIEAL